jgi:peptidylprolyl isomerase domain and WD repeat-containing protein 1
MSDSEQDASVLGKRTRNKNDQLDDDMPENAPPEEDDDDSDDVGPMPMPEAVANAGSKKKRKGMYSAIRLL